MDVLRIASFSDGENGGNPAGVAFYDELPSAETMQKLAFDVGFSETAFASPMEGKNNWRVRYFSPESEVPFCGHATIALGAALARREGDGDYALKLNNAAISVEGNTSENGFSAALQSPPTKSMPLNDVELNLLLSLFGLERDQLDMSIPPAEIHGGADHYVLALKSRDDLSAMNYDLEEGRTFMNRRGLITVMLVYKEHDRKFHTRNAFASGGVFEDPATGAASAAFAGYLRDIKWPHENNFQIIQGEDMGMRSIIDVDLTNEKGASIRVSGAARLME
ncbi:PhzF family phenazine biosynthesis protein [Lentilitoribacter sp. EG35]|uniref:PhzF family phenazine biosynthesis protein n=1 Tax=Lentilitoribacter sp. EG35 TaxID=3234192 RepID=UPI00346030C5